MTGMAQAAASVVAVLLLSAACGGEGAGKKQPLPEGAGAVVREEDLPKDLSAYQRAILGDGILTVAEYQRAALDVVRCHKEAGANIVGPPVHAGEAGVKEPWWSPRGQYMYGAMYPDSEAAAEQKSNACEDEYFRYIGPIWANYIAPTPKEMQEARDIVGRCLRDIGIDVPEHPATQDLGPLIVARRLEPEVARCARLGADHIGMMFFAG
jgi:hypothetical protein